MEGRELGAFLDRNEDLFGEEEVPDVVEALACSARHAVRDGPGQPLEGIRVDAGEEERIVHFLP